MNLKDGVWEKSKSEVLLEDFPVRGGFSAPWPRVFSLGMAVARSYHMMNIHYLPRDCLDKSSMKVWKSGTISSSLGGKGRFFSNCSIVPHALA